HGNRAMRTLRELQRRNHLRGGQRETKREGSEKARDERPTTNDQRPRRPSFVIGRSSLVEREVHRPQRRRKHHVERDLEMAGEEAHSEREAETDRSFEGWSVHGAPDEQQNHWEPA